MRHKGKIGEDQAVHFLQKQGYCILKRNYYCIFGEIDIIALQGEILCFIEVKSRSTQNFGTPAEAVTRAKQRKISRVALHYISQEYPIPDPICRFDVICILPDQEPEIIQDAFQGPV